MDSWSTDEDWALQDSAPAFTVGRGNERATFWTALVASTPDLAKRSAAECEKRLRELKEKAEVGSAPLVLDEWKRLDDGRYTGRVTGESGFVWLTASTEGRLASDPRDEPGYIEVVGGKIYELGRRAPDDGSARSVKFAGNSVPLSPASSEADAKDGLLSMRLPYALTAALLAGGLGFGMGSVLAPPPPPPPLPPPPPPMTRVIIRETRAPAGRYDGVSPQQRLLQEAPPLTPSEQRERAELRLDRDKMRLQSFEQRSVEQRQNLEQRIKEDEQKIKEAKRVEAEAAMKSITPSTGDPRVFPQ